VPERITAVRSIPRDENDRIDLAATMAIFQSLNPVPEVA
jgi:hypothetical protein